VIIELASISTINEDLGPKKRLYEQTFRTPEYFCYNRFHNRLHGWRLIGGRYQELQPNEKGWLWSEELQLWVGTWEGEALKAHEI
jgi:Uma2 family endonuclease